MKKKTLIIGGGAAGFFLAANLKGTDITILEQAATPMNKVKISGGGRCNVTHACFDPSELILNYPRGGKELRSVFSRFAPGDTMEWFEKQGVPLKIEADNRVFPSSNFSGDIVTALYKKAVANGAEIFMKEGVTEIKKTDEGFWQVYTKSQQFMADYLVICTGSSQKSWSMLQNLGHTIISPVPSLFTFNCKDLLLKDLQGISFPETEVKIPSIGMEQSGPLLITHWGLSGPAILKLSAFGALELAACNYQFDLEVNFINQDYTSTLAVLRQLRDDWATKQLKKHNPFNLTKRFWERLVEVSQIETINYAECSNKTLEKLAKNLTSYVFKIEGKSTYKDEFVTAGGIDLKEIDFKTMESKLHPNLFFAGEVLNIDAITGGFNFQACWSEAFVIAEGIDNQQIIKN